MKKNISLILPPEKGFDERSILDEVRKKMGISTADNNSISIKKRSIDARGKKVKIHLDLDVFINEKPKRPETFSRDLPLVNNSEPVLIIGSGPAGLFAAIKLIENGLKPIVLERGKDVRSRRRDIAKINRQHIVDPDSNYCFGEGGAGTYSDGKLYTRANKRGDVGRILEIFVAFGAEEKIRYEAHPHIGTNKLPDIIRNMRDSILAAGGEIYFETKVTDLVLKGEEIKGVQIESGEELDGLAVILATGHSARDIYELLYRKKIFIESKPFAIGLRAEHPQELIDKIQYHCDNRGPYLPAASYSLASQTRIQGVQRGVFSFCMCPGGFIVPSATTEGEVVVNGMSPSRRNSRYANSGIVVAVEVEDMKKFNSFGPLAAMKFQSEIETKACRVAGGNQTAPAQRMVDFTENRISNDLPDCSYQPGLASVELRDVLPENIASRLGLAFREFNNKMKGYYTNEAVLVGVESRTSSPVRIPRNKDSLEHVQIKRLYPCGEGAGYAGGIVSAAMDGEKCANHIAVKYKINKAVIN